MLRALIIALILPGHLRRQALSTNTPIRVERSTDLSGPWTAIATNLTSGSFTDTNAPSGSAFYRLVTEP